MSDEPYSKARCDKYSGVRGPDWDVWSVSWQEYSQAEFEPYDDYSKLDVTLAQDRGAANGPAMPIGGGALEDAQRKFKKRQLATARELSRLQEDLRIRRMIIALPPGDAYTRVNGEGIGRRAWLLLESECSEAMTALEIRTKIKEYAGASIRASVGFSVSSVTDFHRVLCEIIIKIPAANKPTDTDHAERMLECIGDECPDSALALEATKELQASTGRQFVRANVALPKSIPTPWRTR